jgi:hypothetical protein
MRPAIIIFAALALGAPACGDGGSDTPPDAAPLPDGAVPRQVITENVPLAINETVEAIMVGGGGDTARIRATVPSAALDWNLHGHAGGGTQVAQEGFKVMMVDYQFSPTAQADWFLLLRNKGQTDLTVELKIELFGNMTWSGWQ